MALTVTFIVSGELSEYKKISFATEHVHFCSTFLLPLHLSMSQLWIEMKESALSLTEFGVLTSRAVEEHVALSVRYAQRGRRRDCMFIW